jgi:ABC-type cobalt transport system substrate-binding protein
VFGTIQYRIDSLFEVVEWRKAELFIIYKKEKAILVVVFIAKNQAKLWQASDWDLTFEVIESVTTEYSALKEDIWKPQCLLKTIGFSRDS